MCTLTVAWGVFADDPLVVVANRDERLDRPSSGPERHEDELTVVAPRDGEAGGTWIGYNERGLFAGITNRWTDDRDDPGALPGRTSGDGRAASHGGERSRGLLVRDALAQPTAKEAARLVEREVASRTYDPFNLLVADGFAGDPPAGFGAGGEAGDPTAGPVGANAADPAAAIYLEYDGALRTRTLDPGVHVVVNVGSDGEYVVPAGREDAAREQAGNADRLRAHLQPEPGESPDEWRRRAREAVADHDFGVCVHGEGFGTRSSSALSFGAGGVLYEYADGPPCETEFERVAASVLE